MADEVAHPKIVLEVEHQAAIAAFIKTGEASKDLGAAIEALSKQWSAHADTSAKAERSIKRTMDALVGGGATRKLQELDKALERLGGAGQLTSTQLANLGSRISSLVSSGGQASERLTQIAQSVEAMKSAAASGATGTAALGNALQAQVVAGAQAASGQLGALGSVLAAIGPGGIAAAAGLAGIGAGVAVLGEAASAAVQYGSRISDMAMRSDMSVASLQKFEFAASLVGASVESLSASSTKLNQALIATPERFKQIGLEAGEIAKLAPEQQFMEVAKALEGVDDRARRNVISMQLLGKSASETAAIMKAMGEGAGDRASSLGLVMGDDVIANLDRVDDAATTLSKTWDGLFRNIGAAIVASPEVAAAINSIADAVGSVSKGVQDNASPLTTFFGTLADGVMNTVEVLSNMATVASAIANSPIVGFFVKINPLVIGAKIAFKELELVLKAVELAAAAVSDVEMPDLTKKVKSFRKDPTMDVAPVSSAEEKLLEKRIVENMKRLAEAEKQAEQHTKALAAEMKELGIVSEATSERIDFVWETINKGGGIAAVSMEGLNKKAKEFAGTAAALPFLLEKVRRSSLDMYQPMGEGLLGAPQQIPIFSRQAMSDMTTLAKGSIVEPLEEVVGFEALAKEEAIDWSRALGDVAHTAEILGGTFAGQVVGAISSVGAALKGFDFSADKAVGTGGLFQKGFSLTGGKGLGGLLGNLSTAGQLASVGLSVGKAIVGAFHQSESEKIAKDVGRDFGVKISEELARTIEKEKRGRFDGALLHLGELIGEAGGLEKFGAGRAAGAMRDLFSAVDRGAITLGEAGKVFDETFGDVAAAHVSKTTGIASAQLRELVVLAKDFGLESEALREFMKGQATGLAGNLAGGLGAMKTSREQGAVGGLASQGAATALSGAVAADFAAMRAAGMSLAEALQAIAPSVTAMREELTAAGLEGTAAFAALEAQIAITTGEVTGPLVAGIGSFTGAMVNMHNMNMLTQADFAGITEQIGINIAALAEQGVVGPAAAQALQPDLQKIWELQQATGYAVDETTQSLIDQAVEAGLVGEQHRSAADKMADASERTAKAIEFLASRFGYLADEVNRVPSEKTIKVKTEYSSSGDSGQPHGGGREPEYYASGSAGFQDFGVETPAFLHGLEAVVTPDEFTRITSTSMLAGAQMLARAASRPASADGVSSSMGPMMVPAAGGGASSAGGASVVININGANKDPKQIADEVAYVLTRGQSPALLDEIRKRASP